MAKCAKRAIKVSINRLESSRMAQPWKRYPNYFATPKHQHSRYQDPHGGMFHRIGWFPGEVSQIARGGHSPGESHAK
ncbi:hypothetical protein K0M31_018936 [Melipona bicolor]|uniref:Uncharacterized protein n=1 Tax=Melipona bicolor TaxID=60889 RepID=A0AA40G4K0_9HYME|nr:hypothetical protein K0M31_018936 [Melipona bicolor]